MTRSCHYCGQSYYRCQQIRAWVVRNPGHRDGWRKEVISVCLNCLDAKATDRVLGAAQFTVSDLGKVRKLTRPKLPRPRLLRTALLLFALLLAPGIARADLLVLDSGALTLEIPAGNHAAGYSHQIFQASGPGLMVDLIGNTGTGLGCTGGLAAECLPGTQLIIHRDDTFDSVRGSLTVQGVTFTGGSGSQLGGWEINGDPITFPAVTTSSFTASTPFMLTFGGGQIGVGFTGQGIATFSFVPDTSLPGALPPRWTLASGVFAINPVPEPGTWLLVFTALSGLWLLRRVR